MYKVKYSILSVKRLGKWWRAIRAARQAEWRTVEHLVWSVLLSSNGVFLDTTSQYNPLIPYVIHKSLLFFVLLKYREALYRHYIIYFAYIIYKWEFFFIFFFIYFNNSNIYFGYRYVLLCLLLRACVVFDFNDLNMVAR